MDYLPLFLLFAAALIAGWFYLQRAKARDARKAAAAGTAQPAASSEPASQRSEAPADRPE